MSRPARNPIDRFAEKVQVSDDCILFTEAVNVGGYGRFWDGNRERPAHVAAYELFVEPIPTGALVCHTCDVPSCVNPDHLYIGTHKTNAQDMHERHRFVGRRKLTDMQVRIIRRLLAGSALSQREIAVPFGVKQVAVSRVKLGQHDYLSRVAA